MDLSKLCFEEKYIPEPNTGCWLWIASTNRLGYGNFWHGKKCLKAHRFSYLLHKGKLQNNLDVMHTCDTRSCVNPDHLKLGTHTDNMRDMWAKGRHSHKGSRNTRAKLTEEDVAIIRRLDLQGEKTKEIANLFKIDPSHIRRIVRRIAGGWGHI